jgi:hypothetical protein
VETSEDRQEVTAETAEPTAGLARLYQNKNFTIGRVIARLIIMLIYSPLIGFFIYLSVFPLRVVNNKIMPGLEALGLGNNVYSEWHNRGYDFMGTLLLSVYISLVLILIFTLLMTFLKIHVHLDLLALLLIIMVLVHPSFSDHSMGFINFNVTIELICIFTAIQLVIFAGVIFRLDRIRPKLLPLKAGIAWLVSVSLGLSIALLLL